MPEVEIKEVMYDNEEDILSIFRAGARSKVSMDIELPKGELVIDYASDGQIVGLEIFNASGYFPTLKNANSNSLTGKFSIQYGPNWAELNFSIAYPGLAQPITHSLISPYNKELVLQA